MIVSMRIKKIITFLLLILISIFSLSSINSVNAATGSKYLIIRLLRESGFGYQVNEKNLWKIVETNSSGTTYNFDNTIYCLKGGPGFGSSDMFGSGEIKARHYTRYFDMKDPESIPSTYRDALPDINSNEYKALLWLLENIFIISNADDPAEIEFKNQLLDAAGVGSYIEDEDIDAAQQLAIWHFTNDDAYDMGTDATFELWMNYIKGNEDNFFPFSDEKGEGAVNGWARNDEVVALYNYLVDTATKKASSYKVQPASQPYELANTTLNLKERQNNYVIGPFRINKISDTTGTLQGKFVNGNNQTLNPTFEDASGRRINNLQDTVGKDFYIVLPNTTNIDKITFTINGSYYNTLIQYWSTEGAPEQDQPVVIIDRTEEDYSDSVEFVKPEEKIFDLALRKFIVSINNIAPSTSRVPNISTGTLNDLKNGTTTTAQKIHPKNPLEVNTGDTVLYTIRVYNEGNVDAIVTEITDYLPDGLKLKDNSNINTNNGWTTSDGKTVTTNKLNGRIISAFDGTNLSYLDVQIECEVTAKVQPNDTKLKNIAEITGATNSEGEEMPDRDSTPDNVEKPYGDESQEDDDDFEDLIITGKYFDLSLRKYITSIAGESVDRVPRVDVSSLSTGTTATYNHTKKVLGVSIGDEVIYTIRVYNEGQIDGYVKEITDHLQANLEFVNDSFNQERGWVLESDGRTVKTTKTANDLISHYNGGTLDYTEVQIKCRVKSTAKPGEKLTNIAEISKFTDADGEQVTDRDSQEGNVTLPNDNTLPNYKDDEINRGDSYIPGQQDDDDFEKVVVLKFDLSLRKFITGVNAEIIKDREPQFHNDNGTYTYIHTKDPVKVKTADTVIYTIRVYNEGEIAGYAEEVKDDIPEGLEFLPDNTTNINYRWVMYDASGKVTQNASEAVTIRTDYLSKAQADQTRRDNLIEAFDPNTMAEPDYKEVRVAFKVTEPNSSDRIIINTAEISEDSNEEGEPVDDIDSTPDNDEDGEDDIDIEKIKVEDFDLALRKFITKINGTPVEVSREPQITAETMIKLANREVTTLDKLHTKEPLQVKTGDTVLYTIRIYNEGDAAGYAKEITDYLPEGLKLKENSDINKKYGWTNPLGDGRTIITNITAGELLDGFNGENLTYIDVEIECEVVATQGASSTSLKNIAEITKAADEDGNEEVIDRDSDENNLTEEQKKDYNPGTSEKGYGYEDDDDYEELVIPSATGDFELKLIKVNGLGNRLSGATFKVDELNAQGGIINTYEGLTTNDAGEVVTDRIAVSGAGTRIFVITEESAPDGYEILAEPIRLEVKVELIDGVYTVTNVNATRPETTVNQSNLQGNNFNSAESLATTISLETNNLNVDEKSSTVSIANGAVKSVEVTEDNTVVITIENTYFDLALRKFITKINGTPVEQSREPQISEETKQNLANRGTTTLEKIHTKTPLQVNTGDTVTYTIRIYNEGEVAGYAKEITDYLPEGLKLKENSTVNTDNGWTNPNGDGRTIVTTALADDLINAFDGTNVNYVDVEIECEVVATKGVTNTSLKNIAEITKAADKDGNEEVKDRDSTPNNLDEDQKNNYNPGTSEKGWGYEDDDDYEELILPPATGEFKIKLIKVNGLGNRLQNAVFKVEEVNEEGTPIVTYDNLTTNENGEILIENIAVNDEATHRYVITEKQAPTGYQLLKDPIVIDVQVKLENGEYKITAEQVNTNLTSNNEQLAKTEDKNSTKQSAKSIKLSSLEKVSEGEKIENTKDSSLADRKQMINKLTRQTSDEITTTSNLVEVLHNAPEKLNEDANNEGEEGNIEGTSQASDAVKDIRIDGNTIEVVIENNYFDLSLRKFITGVNDQNITNRVPIFSNNNGEYTYTHTKDPVEVANGDTVIYTLRVYNEGTIAGYAQEVKDDLPEGLEFLPDNSVNTEYRWVMYDANGEITENVNEAKTIRTDYLSKEQEEESGRNNLLQAFNPDTMTEPDHKDLKIAFKVTEPNTSDRVIINTAEISDDSDEEGEPVDDKDSTPDNDEDEEDDIDIEKVKVTYFDLALKKIISKVTMTLDGKTTVEETGHKFEDNPEEVVKVELGNHKIQTSVLKFTYQIRITNEGNKAGYAYEVKDYIPEGLKFVEEDNKNWVLSEDGKTVTTDQLKDTLLQPGESAIVEITLRWINGQNNLGVKTNWAEISKDSDDDIDSTPDNNTPGEDDIDDASVVLSIVTGIGEHYIGVIVAVLTITAGGVVLIKKFVL